MSGVTPLVDTLLATRLAQRLDLVPLKRQGEIASPGAATGVDKVANDVRLPSRMALEEQVGVGPSRNRNRNALPVSRALGSGGVTLSAVARAVSAILDPQLGALPKTRSSEPLWLQSGPPVAHVLTARLVQTVTQSGLFYESHLQQFAAGSRSLEQMAREPQAGLALSSLLSDAAPDAVLVTLAAPRPDAGQAAATPGAGVPAAQSAALSDAAAQVVRSDSAPQAAVYNRDGKPVKNLLPFHEIAGPAPDAKAPVTGDLDSSRGTAAAAIHPDALGLVRQQLELLSVPVFRWSGEAWPGTPMQWDIQEDQAEDPGTSEGEVMEAAWTTHLTMTLPTLKAVVARLTLAGNTLQLRLSCDEDATLAVLNEGRHALSRRFDPLGLQLTTLQVGMVGAADGTGVQKS